MCWYDVTSCFWLAAKFNWILHKSTQSSPSWQRVIIRPRIDARSPLRKPIFKLSGVVVLLRLRLHWKRVTEMIWVSTIRLTLNRVLSSRMSWYDNEIHFCILCKTPLRRFCPITTGSVGRRHRSFVVSHKVRQSYISRTVGHRITNFSHTDQLYIHTKYDAINNYFQSEAIAKKPSHGFGNNFSRMVYARITKFYMLIRIISPRSLLDMT